MSSPGSRLWRQAWETLAPKYQNVLPSHTLDTPSDLLKELEENITRSKGKPIVLLNGSRFFVRDVLQKAAHWIKKFVEVGDTIVQYDPGHAALPWAALRLLLQASINNAEKHAAVLEGIEAISRWLVLAKIQKSSLIAQLQRYPELEKSFQDLYASILVLIARSLIFVRKSKQDRFLASFRSSDSKFRKTLDDIEKMQKLVESQIAAINGTTILDRTRLLLDHAQLLLDLQKPIPRLEASLHRTSKVVDRMEIDRILDWASTIPYEKHHKDVVRKTLKGTGTWLLKDPMYFDWQNSSSSDILWLHGGAGSGKSTLLSMVAQELIESHASSQTPFPMYFYCSRNVAEPERADAESILCSLARQASDLPGGSELHGALRERYHRRRTAGSLSVTDATDIVIAATADRSATFILLDALDECDPESRGRLLESLATILRGSTGLTKIFVTSRDHYYDISHSMERYPGMCVNASRNRMDIELYVRETVENAVCSRRILRTVGVTKALQEKIVAKLCKGAEGMFRWVQLQLEFLYTIKITSILEDRLEKLSPGLEQSYRELYELKMDELGDEQGGIVRRILSWLLISQRSLTTSELGELTMGTIPSELTVDTVLEICFNLVDLDHEQDQFRFSHPSVREFLEGKLEYHSSILHDMAVSDCLKMISEISELDRGHYAMAYWPLHAELNNPAGNLSKQARKGFLCRASLSFERWAQEMRTGSVERGLKLAINDCVLSEYPLQFICAKFGLEAELRETLEHRDWKTLLQSVTPTGHRLLSIASGRGHTTVVRLLLDAGAEVNPSSRDTVSALVTAAWHGHVEVVNLLLISGADVNISRSYTLTALTAASYRGHVDTVDILLNAGANPNLQSTYDGESPLMAASRKADEKVVRLLLSAGADVNAFVRTKSALSIAASWGRIETAKLLLKAGAKVSSKVIVAAQWDGHEAIAELLLEEVSSIHIQSRDRLGRLSTHIAATHDYPRGIELSKDRGLDVNEADYHGWTPLHWAAYFGSTRAIQRLLAFGADVSLLDWQAWTPADVARFAGHEEATKCLVEPVAVISPLESVRGSNDRYHCDSCGRYDPPGVQYHCTACPSPPGFDLCFRCIRDVPALHPEHEFTTGFCYRDLAA